MPNATLLRQFVYNNPPPQGILKTSGLNQNGQLGVGNSSTVLAFTQVGGPNLYRQARFTGASLLAIRDDGALMGAGFLSGVFNRTTLGRIGTANHWKHIYTSASHHAFLTDNDGYLYGLGYGNSFGHTTANVTFNTPTRLFDDVRYKKLVHGFYAIIAIDQDDNLVGWGQATENLLLGQSTNYHTRYTLDSTGQWVDIAMGTKHVLAIKKDGRLYGWGNGENGCLGLAHTGNPINVTTPRTINSDTDWKAVFAGHNTSFAIKNNGDVYAFGYNSGNELGYNSGNQNNHTLAKITAPSDTIMISSGMRATIVTSEETVGKTSGIQSNTGSTGGITSAVLTNLAGTPKRLISSSNSLQNFCSAIIEAVD